MSKVKYNEPLWDILMEMYSLEKVTKLTKNQTLTELRRNIEERLDNERIARELDGFFDAAEDVVWKLSKADIFLNLLKAP